MAQYNHTNTGAEIDSAVDAVELAKAASSTDNSPGRLLKLNDFGVGGYITLSAVSLDTIDQTSGFYYCINCTDRPAAINGYMDVYVNSPDSFAKQTYSAIGDSRTWIRTLFSGTWSDWIPVATSENNSLIEFGSNANGSFTKFPDGTLICIQNISSSSGSWTYPSAFNAVPRISASVDSSGAANRSALTSSTTATSTNLAVYDASNTLVTTAVNLIAIGRWK